MSEEKQGIAPVLFEHEMQATSKIFGRDSKMRVEIKGDRAYTDNNTVVLPAVDHSKPIEDFTARVARGYVDHEAAHKRHTDFKSGWIEKAKEHSKYAEALLQGIEDVRIEGKAVDEYPGSKVNLEAAVQAVTNRLIELGNAGEFKDKDIKAFLPVVTAIAGRAEQLNFNTQKLDELKALLPAGTWEKASEIAAHVPKLANTGDAYKLMLRYVDEEYDEEEEDQNGQGSGDGEGEGEGNGGNGGQGGNGKGKRLDAGDQSEDIQPISGEFSDAVNDLMGGGSNQRYGGDAPYIPAREYDHVVTSKDKAVGALNPGGWQKDANQKGRYDNMRSQLGPQVQAVKQAFERGLLVDTTRGWEGAQHQGRLDPRRLGMVPAGMENVFRKRDQQQDLDVAVTLLVDGSGSMSGNEIMTATQVCIALSEALNKLGVAFEISWFCSSGQVPPSVMQWATRHCRLVYLVMKGFDERLFEARGAIGRMSTLAMGGTPEGAALEVAYLRIKQRHEKRKVIITMVDGGPGVSGSADEGAFLRDLIHHIRRDPSMTLASIGICTNSPEYFYGPEHTAVVNNLTELPRVALTHIRKLIAPKKGTRRAA